MNALEETMDATLDANGELRLAHQRQLPPGPVQVTIRAIAAMPPVQGSDEWARLLRSAASDCGVCLSNEAVSSDALYE